MVEKNNLIMVDSTVLPDVFLKVLTAKKLLRQGEVSTVHEAAHRAGISRSAFYKYKDYVFAFNETQGILTLFFELMDIPGILSEILNVLANASCNILTINQNIPVNGVANITISLQTDNINCEIESLLKTLGQIQGINGIEILAKQ